MAFKRWAHAEEGNSTDFDDNFYQEQPRTGLLGFSMWDEILSHSGDYSADGSPDTKLVIAPAIGDSLVIVGEFGEDVSDAGAYLKFTIEKNGTRVVLESWSPGGGVLFPTKYRKGPYDLSSVGALGDLRGEDFTLEFYLKHLTQTAEMRHVRVYAGVSAFYATDYLR